MTQQTIKSADWAEGNGADDALLAREVCPNDSSHPMDLKLQKVEHDSKGMTRIVQWQCRKAYCKYELAFSRTIPHKPPTPD